jgi:hypothetical protein
MTDYDSYNAGTVHLEFVDAPALNAEHIDWTFRTVGGATAPAGTVAAQIAVMSHDHRILGGGTNTLHSELGPHDTGGGRINVLQYTHDDGDYYITITIGSDVRTVAYRIHNHEVHAV